MSEPGENCIGLGLVGAGRWGARYLQTLADIEGIVLRVVASRNPATRKMLPRTCEVVGDWRSALACEGLDGLIIASPPATHFEIASAGCSAGIAVLIEKPVTLDSAQARQLSKLAGDRNVPVLVGHTHLFASAYETLKARAPGLGRPWRIRSVGANHGPFRDDVDALWDYGPHDVAMCLDLVGQDPVGIRARSAATAHNSEAGGILVDARLEFADGSVADLTFGNLLAAKQRLFRVDGTRGGLVYDDLAPHKLVELGPDGQCRSAVKISSQLPLARAVIAFREAINQGSHSAGSLQLGVRVVETLEAIARDVGLAPADRPQLAGA